MRKPITVILRAVVAQDCLSRLPLVPTGTVAWLSRTSRGRIYVISDVPGRVVDVLLCDVPDGLDDPVWVLEVAHKSGKFDGSERVRLCLRPVFRRDLPCMSLTESQTYPPIEVRIGETYDEWSVCVGSWGGAFQRLRAQLVPGGLSRIVGWHARRYFRHLTVAEVDDACALFEAEMGPAVAGGGGVGLAEANRIAERLLYRASVDAGWRKLTLRERERLGLDGGHWWREERIAERRAALAGAATPTGCGEWTLRSARPEY